MMYQSDKTAGKTNYAVIVIFKGFKVLTAGLTSMVLFPDNINRHVELFIYRKQ
jgi:hypothetical protein